MKGSENNKVLAVIPNWNADELLTECLKALASQTVECDLFVVDNGSTDNSVDVIKKYTEKYRLNDRNMGFTGGVNPGLEFAIKEGYDYVLLINNDAVADKKLVGELSRAIASDKRLGIATSKILMTQGNKIDSTGEFMSVWGLPFSRGRGRKDTGQFDNKTDVFGASGGASLYRVDMLKEVGIMDDDFFAYYEDVDLSYRAQLAGWLAVYEPGAIVRHEVGATSGRMKGFTTQMTLKNLPWLVIKNTPTKYILKVLPRFTLAYGLFVIKALLKMQFREVFLGVGKMLWLMPKKLVQRYRIQTSRKVSADYMWSILHHDLPPAAKMLRVLRSKIVFWKNYEI